MISAGVFITGDGQGDGDRQNWFFSVSNNNGLDTNSNVAAHILGGPVTGESSGPVTGTQALCMILIRDHDLIVRGAVIGSDGHA